MSDLHLGEHTERDLLRRSEPLAALLQQLPEFDRLVLLGDLLELRQEPVRDVLNAAHPVLAQIGDALGPGREVVIVPGNHDHHLLSAWLDRRARTVVPAALGLEAAVDWNPGEPLAKLARWLGPAEVRAAYPGVWLGEDVYAIHGHYGDRHTTVPMFERLGAGAMARIVGEPAAGPERAEDYEAILAPIYAWIHAIAQSSIANSERGSRSPSSQAWQSLEGSRARGGGRLRARSIRRRGLTAAFPAVVAGLNRARLGPLRADVSGPELRRASLRALGEVLARLRVDSRHVIFGHTHRAGPLPGEDRSEWEAPTGARMLNTGSWVHEPGFVGNRPLESPYRPGFAAVLEAPGSPELVNLLDGLTPDRG